MTDKQPFDNIAATYDENFTYSVTGKAQRNIVYSYLKKNIKPGLSVLEINCGTGVDAFYMASYGCMVTATDGSEKMISICKAKALERGVENPSFIRISFDELASMNAAGTFNLCFSNFSGLNFLDPDQLRRQMGTLHHALNHGSAMILILSGKKCIWENLYLLLKGRFGDIGRKNRKGSAMASIGEARVPVYYYSVKEMRELAGDRFEFINARPVGLFLPPNYLESFFKNKKLFMKILTMKESFFGRFSFLSDYADHYLIEFKRR